MIHEDPAHQPRSHREKVPAILPIDLFHSVQPQERLVHQGRRLQGVSRPLTRHALPGDPAKFPVHQRDELPQCHLIACPPGEEKLRDLVGIVWNGAILRLFRNDPAV